MTVPTSGSGPAPSRFAALPSHADGAPEQYPRVEPERLRRDADGTPFSDRYRDVYHPREGAFGQAEHVFLRGAQVRQRWASRPRFVVAETGFGLGVNFLSLWNAWRHDPARPKELFFLSVERHPLPAADLADAHAGLSGPAGLGQLSARLLAQWPLATPGLHRLRFEDGAVTLLLMLEDVERGLAGFDAAVDAIFLDGFAPARNPRMWAAPVLRTLARLARRDATLATWCAAGAVRRDLSAAGFDVQAVPGWGRKREITVARFAPRWPWRYRGDAPEGSPEGGFRGAPVLGAEDRTAPGVGSAPRSTPLRRRRALVLGAGIAGAAAAASLAARGWSVTVFERDRGIALAASGNAAGALHPHLSLDDCLRSRATRAGYAIARHELVRLGAFEQGWARETGMLECADSHAAFERIRLGAQRLALPAGYAVAVDAADAGARLGVDVKQGGWWLHAAAWAVPGRWAAAWLGAGGVELRLGMEVATLGRRGDEWMLLDRHGTVLDSAPVLVLANGAEVDALAGSLAAGPLAAGLVWPLRRVRGQLTCVRAEAVGSLRAIVSGAAYAVPFLRAETVVGATYEYPDADSPEDAPARAEADRSNLQRLARTLGRDPQALASAEVTGHRVGVRSVSHDRMPLVGPVADVASAVRDPRRQASAPLDAMPRLSGLWICAAYASRGLTWAALAGEIVAAAIEAEPAPASRDVVRALDPARFLLRALRTGRT